MSLVIFHMKLPRVRVLCGVILLGLVRHQDHGLETETMGFPRPQRRSLDIKPEDSPLPPLPPATVCRAWTSRVSDPRQEGNRLLRQREMAAGGSLPSVLTSLIVNIHHKFPGLLDVLRSGLN